MIDEIIDKKYWVDGWWCKDFKEAKHIAQREDRWRISYTPDNPRNLKLIAVKGFGKWHVFNHSKLDWLIVRFFRERYDGLPQR